MKKPDSDYRASQRKLQASLLHDGSDARPAELRRQMEREFMAAWQLGPDRLRLAYRLKHRLDTLQKSDQAFPTVNVLDHCSYYTGIHDQRIIVTQPYGDCEHYLNEILSLDATIAPEIVHAPEWGFYSPGKADFFILQFPYRYSEVLAKVIKKLHRGFTRQEINASLPLDRNFGKRLQTCVLHN